MEFKAALFIWNSETDSLTKLSRVPPPSAGYDLPWGVQFPFEAQESRSTPILLLDVVSVSNEVQEKFASGNLAQFNPTIYPVTLPHPGYRSIRTYHAY